MGNGKNALRLGLMVAVGAALYATAAAGEIARGSRVVTPVSGLGAKGTRDAQVQALVDRADIDEVISKLGHELDIENWDEFRNVFTENAVGVFPHGTYNSRAEIMQAGRSQGATWDRTLHMITDRSIQLHGDRATVDANFAAFNSPKAQKDDLDAHFDVGGHYEFQMVRTAAGWRIAHLELNYLWTNSIHAPAEAAQASGAAAPGKVEPIPPQFRGSIPYLNVREGWKAVEFYKKAFGAREITSFPRKGNKLAHAEMRIGDAVFMVRDEFPEYKFFSPQTVGGTPLEILIYVDDVNAFTQRAVAAGAKVIRPVEKQFHADLMSELEDPYGFRWFFATRIEPVDEQKMKDSAGKS